MSEPVGGEAAAHTGSTASAPPLTRLRKVRRLLPVWTIREVRAQYRQSAFDIGWSLATPVITLAGFGFVLTKAFGVDGDGVPYLVFAWTGVVIWQFVANALIRGASSLVWAAELVRKVAFPREVVPLATVLSAGLDLGIGMVAALALVLIQRVHVGIEILGVVPVFAVMVLWVAAASVLLATVTSFLRDLTHGLSVLLRVGIFVTPVMYPASQVPHRYRWSLSVNPIAVFIDETREALLRQHWPHWDLLGLHAIAALLLLAVALWYLRRVEGRIADVI